MIAEGTSCDRARTDRNYNLGFGYRIVSLLERPAHVSGNWSRNQDTVRMARRRHELDAEASQIEYDCIQDVDIRFAAVATARADLPKLERTAKNALELIGKPTGKLERVSRLQNQIVAMTGCETVLPAELDCSLWTSVRAFRTKEASSQVDSQTLVAADRLGWAYFDTSGAAGWTSRLVD
jgi:hypothetical protein